MNECDGYGILIKLEFHTAQAEHALQGPVADEFRLHRVVAEHTGLSYQVFYSHAVLRTSDISI